MPSLVKCGSTIQSLSEADPRRRVLIVFPPGCSNIVDISGICYNTLLSLDFTSPPFYTVQLTYPLCKPGSGTVNVLLAKNSTSVLGPFVNGVEIYSVGDVAVGTDDTQGALVSCF